MFRIYRCFDCLHFKILRGRGFCLHKEYAVDEEWAACESFEREECAEDKQPIQYDIED